MRVTQVISALLTCALAIVGAITRADAQQGHPQNANLTACLNGYFGCDPAKLAPQDVARVEQAAYQRNLNACLSGYPNCEASRLAVLDIGRVEQAAYQRNLSTCVSGYPHCALEKVAPADRPKIEQASYQRNLSSCLGGTYGCDRTKLSAHDSARVDEAIQRLPRQAFAPPITTGSPSPLDGYGAISPITGLPRTIAVRGYVRKDGTYVRPHYRSRRR